MHLLGALAAKRVSTALLRRSFAFVACEAISREALQSEYLPIYAERKKTTSHWKEHAAKMGLHANNGKPPNYLGCSLDTRPHSQTFGSCGGGDGNCCEVVQSIQHRQ